MFNLIFLLITTILACCAENNTKKYLHIIDLTLSVTYGLIEIFVFRETKINSHIGVNEQQSPLDTIPELSQVLNYPICQVSVYYFTHLIVSLYCILAVDICLKIYSRQIMNII